LEEGTQEAGKHLIREHFKMNEITSGGASLCSIVICRRASGSSGCRCSLITLLCVLSWWILSLGIIVHVVGIIRVSILLLGLIVCRNCPACISDRSTAPFNSTRVDTSVLSYHFERHSPNHQTDEYNEQDDSAE
jgi:hypothetical protein